jgi:hypothetical protein
MRKCEWSNDISGDYRTDCNYLILKDIVENINPLRYCVFCGYKVKFKEVKNESNN